MLRKRHAAPLMLPYFLLPTRVMCRFNTQICLVTQLQWLPHLVFGDGQPAQQVVRLHEVHLQRQRQRHHSPSRRGHIQNAGGSSTRASCQYSMLGQLDADRTSYLKHALAWLNVARLLLRLVCQHHSPRAQLHHGLRPAAMHSNGAEAHVLIR